MSKRDRQQLSILVVLLGVLGLTLVLGYRMVRPPVAATIQLPETKKTSANPPAATDAQIRLDLVDKSEAGEQGVGKRNVFQYGLPPAPPPPPPQRGNPINIPTAVVPPNVVTTPVITVPPARPLPPPITLKYQGFAAIQSPGAGFTAFLADDARHYNVTTGEILMGRYRIVSITDKSVEIEDLEYNRRQTLPLVK